jgi:hypothetical protein
MTSDDFAPPLDELARQLHACRREARELVRDLSPEALLWRPDPKRWSIAHCLDHLAETQRLYEEFMVRGIDEGRRRGLLGGAGRWNLVERSFVRFLEPPPRFKMPAPARFVPDPPVSGAEALARYEASHDRLDELLAASEGLDLVRVKVSEPLFPPWKVGLGATFGILAAHERRHVWQMGRLVAAPGFPG